MSSGARGEHDDEAREVLFAGFQSQFAAVGVIESVKVAVDLYAPVAGEVVEVNAPLADHYEPLSLDPYGRGWMVKIRVAGADALAGLLGPQEYRKHLESEAKH